MIIFAAYAAGCSCLGGDLRENLHTCAIVECKLKSLKNCQMPLTATSDAQLKARITSLPIVDFIANERRLAKRRQCRSVVLSLSRSIKIRY